MYLADLCKKSELKSGSFHRHATQTSIFHSVFVALMFWMQLMLFAVVTVLLSIHWSARAGSCKAEDISRYFPKACNTDVDLPLRLCCVNVLGATAVVGRGN